MNQELKTQGAQAMANTDDFLSPTRPEEFGQRDLSGTEGMTKADIKLPRLTLLQTQSPQCVEGDPLYNPELKPGLFINDITGQVYGRGPLHFAIIRRDPPRAMQFAPFDSGGGMIDPDVPLDDERLQWHGREKPVATLFYDFICMLLPSWEFIVISLKGSSLKSARALNGYIAMRQDALYRGVYTVHSEVKMKPKPHQIFVFKNAGWAAPAVESKLKTLYESFKDQAVEFSRDTAVDEEVDFPAVPLETNGEPGEPAGTV